MVPAVAEIRENDSEVIRVERGDYNGTDLLHVRTWHNDGSGDHKPMRKGLSLCLRLATWRELLPAIQERVRYGTSLYTTGTAYTTLTATTAGTKRGAVCAVLAVSTYLQRQNHCR